LRSAPAARYVVIRVRPTRDEALARIAEEEARLAELDRQRDDARARLDALRQQLAAAAAPAATPRLPVLAAAPATNREKVALFRALFRGREDVFPTRFVSKKTGKPGYAPACTNKFVRGVCGLLDLPPVRCGDCPNQAFVPLSNQVVLGHLRGDHVMGVYPLLEDETCWFLAADFDGKSWRDDISAFVETCRSAGVPVAIERSRSGNGAHAWFFFAAPVLASVARHMGCHLITETMARRHQLDMRSYDRLFPSQDTMPRGGFGNLIALPLQHEPRQQSNSVFLDDKLEPHADQWAFLASVQRVAPTAVEAIAREAVRRGQVVGLRLVEPADDDDTTPWARPASGQRQRPSIAGPLPKQVRAVGEPIEDTTVEYDDEALRHVDEDV
jgi:hypothetical protein